jgi:hypothetical protein
MVNLPKIATAKNDVAPAVETARTLHALIMCVVANNAQGAAREASVRFQASAVLQEHAAPRAAAQQAMHLMT